MALRHPTPLARPVLIRSFRGGADASSADDGSEVVAPKLEELMNQLDLFMAQFQRLEEAVSSEAMPNFLGMKPKPADVAGRADRVAFKQAFHALSELHVTVRDRKAGSEFISPEPSLNLLKQLSLFVAEGADDVQVPVGPEMAAQLAALRKECLRKPKGTVARAMSELRDTLAALSAAHTALLQAVGLAGDAATAAAAEAAAYSTAAAASASLSREEITAKLNAVPTFALLNKDDEVVMMQNDDGTEACLWFIDPGEAEATLAAATAANPDVEGLHLGVSPLGMAFSTCGGWIHEEGASGKGGAPSAPAAANGGFDGELRLQGSSPIVNKLAPQLREQLHAQGLEAGGWQLPIFACDELQSPSAMPMFFSHADVSAAWELSGRLREDVPEQLTVMDLRLLVHQMETSDAFPWAVVQFLCSPAAAELAHKARAHALASRVD